MEPTDQKTLPSASSLPSATSSSPMEEATVAMDASPGVDFRGRSQRKRKRPASFRPRRSTAGGTSTSSSSTTSSQEGSSNKERQEQEQEGWPSWPDLETVVPRRRTPMGAAAAAAEDVEGDLVHPAPPEDHALTAPANIDVADNAAAAMQTEKEEKPTGEEQQQQQQQEKKCGICFEVVEEQGVLDSCRHEFCFTCIHRWSKTANSCPMCKADFFTITRAALLRPSSAADPHGAEEAEEEDDGCRRPRKRNRRGGGRRARATNRSKRAQPQVVRVKPKKQQYTMSRREIEDIARAADLAEIHGAMQTHRPFLFHSLGAPSGGGLAAVMGLLLGVGRHHDDDDEDDDDDDDEDDGAPFGDGDDDDALGILSGGEESIDYESLFGADEHEDADDNALPRRRASRANRRRTRDDEGDRAEGRPNHGRHWGEAEAEPQQEYHHAVGVRDRIRHLMEARSRERMRSTPVSRGFPSYGAAHAPRAGSSSLIHESPFIGVLARQQQEHQQRMEQGLESLKAMFGDSMSADVLEAVLHQMGGSVERAIDAIFSMQCDSDASSEVSIIEPPHTTTTTSSTLSSSASSTHFADQQTPSPTSSRLSLPPPRYSPDLADSSVIVVPSDDVEIIAERRVTASRTHRGTPSTRHAPTADHPPFSTSLPTFHTTSTTDTDAPSVNARRMRFPARRYGPSSSTPSPSPSAATWASLPPLVADDCDLSQEEGLEMAWRDYAEMRRETDERKTRREMSLPHPRHSPFTATPPLPSLSSSSSQPSTTAPAVGQPPSPSSALRTSSSLPRVSGPGPRAPPGGLGRQG